MEQTYSPSRFRLELSALPASPGVAVGPASILERHGVQVLRETIAEVEVEAEQRAARAALRAVQDELERAKGRLPHGEHAQILEAQKAMLEDPDLLAAIDDGILGGHPDRNRVPGVEASTGSLGHGFPMVIGVALGLKASTNMILVEPYYEGRAVTFSPCRLAQAKRSQQELMPVPLRFPDSVVTVALREISETIIKRMSQEELPDILDM